MCDEDIIRTDDIITYDSIVQKSLNEYRNIFDSKRWEPTDNKKTSKYEPLILKASINWSSSQQYSGKNYFLNRQNGKDYNSGVGSYTKSVGTCHKCGKRNI